MQRLKFCVWVIFIFRQPHQIVGGHTVKVRKRCNRKRADVLVVIGFVFSQRRFRPVSYTHLDVYKRQARLDEAAKGENDMHKDHTAQAKPKKDEREEVHHTIHAKFIMLNMR